MLLLVATIESHRAKGESLVARIARYTGRSPLVDRIRAYTEA